MFTTAALQPAANGRKWEYFVDTLKINWKYTAVWLTLSRCVCTDYDENISNSNSERLTSIFVVVNFLAVITPQKMLHRVVFIVNLTDLGLDYIKLKDKSGWKSREWMCGKCSPVPHGFTSCHYVWRCQILWLWILNSDLAQDLHVGLFKNCV